MIKRFFGRLFATKAYLATLTDAQLAARSLSGEALYNYAYHKGRMDLVSEQFDRACQRTEQLANSIKPVVVDICDENGNYLFTSYSWE